MFKYNISHQDQTTVFELIGQMSLEDSFHLRQAFFDEIKDAKPAVMIVDFSQVCKADAAMLSLLIATKNVVERHGARFVLRSIPQQEMLLFQNTSMNRYFEIEDDMRNKLDSRPQMQES